MVLGAYDQQDGDPLTPSYEPLNVDYISDMSVRALHKAEDIAWRLWDHKHLPKWLRDNDFLIKGHRPPLNSFWACFKSIFRIHTETGNIWTHLLGCMAFIGVTLYFMTRPSVEIPWQEKAVFSAFFGGAILCLGFSFLFHTLFCHSEKVGKLFMKLDYCGISLLILGSFVPWVYYAFYCRTAPKVTYFVLMFIMAMACIVISTWDKFSHSDNIITRTGVFVALGIFGTTPAFHYMITDGYYGAVKNAALGCVALVSVLYFTGAVFYALRVPERFWPGKFDIWSHQIFHIFVIAAALVYFNGISELAVYRRLSSKCPGYEDDL